MSYAIKVNTDLYSENFQAFEKSLNGEASAWLHQIRKNAFQRFMDLGFPTTRHEEWKYTNISSIAKEKFEQIYQPQLTDKVREAVHRYSYDNLNVNLIVFVDGMYVRELSRLNKVPDGVNVGSLDDALKSDGEIIKNHLTRYAHYDKDTFTALSTAFVRDGAFVYLPDNTQVEDSIHLLYLSSEKEKPFITFPRNLIICGKNTEANIIETYAGAIENTYFTNTVTEIYVSEDSRIDHIKIQEESENAYHISTMVVCQRAGSNFSSHGITFGGLITRNNPIALLDAEGIESTLNGLYLGTGKQLIDNHTTIDHAKPHCNSHELYKGILDGKAKGVFNGKIFVRRNAQKTDAKQTNQAVLLSDEATFDTKPQLEIFADDVKCTHGATVGHLDKNAMFYLQSRGIDYDTAEDILTYAFASEVIDRIKVKELRDYLHHRVLTKLQQDRLTGIDEV